MPVCLSLITVSCLFLSVPPIIAWRLQFIILNRRNIGIPPKNVGLQCAKWYHYWCANDNPTESSPVVLGYWSDHCTYWLTKNKRCLWLVAPRVYSKQTKINFGSNLNKPKQDLFRVCFGCFVKQNTKIFRFVSVLRTKQPKQTELFRNKTKKIFNRTPTVTAWAALLLADTYRCITKRL